MSLRTFTSSHVAYYQDNPCFPIAVICQGCTMFTGNYLSIGDSMGVCKSPNFFPLISQGDCQKSIK